MHLEHGIGIYQGMTTVMHGASTIEVAVVAYEGGDRLNVPLYRLDQVEKYRAAGDLSDEAPPRDCTNSAGSAGPRNATRRAPRSKR